jgi:hypothetical protein
MYWPTAAVPLFEHVTLAPIASVGAQVTTPTLSSTTATDERATFPMFLMT